MQCSRSVAIIELYNILEPGTCTVYPLHFNDQTVIVDCGRGCFFFSCNYRNWKRLFRARRHCQLV